MVVLVALHHPAAGGQTLLQGRVVHRDLSHYTAAVLASYQPDHSVPSFRVKTFEGGFAHIIFVRSKPSDITDNCLDVLEDRHTVLFEAASNAQDVLEKWSALKSSSEHGGQSERPSATVGVSSLMVSSSEVQALTLPRAPLGPKVAARPLPAQLTGRL